MLKKQDIWLIGICLIIGIAVFGVFRQRKDPGSGKAVVIYLGEEEKARYSLDEEVDVTLEGIKEGHNHLIIREGKADVTEATCPDQICVKQAAVSEIGEVIVCLPNQVIVAIEGE